MGKKSKKRNWLVKYEGHEVEGLATDYNNACRKAFRLLIQGGLIKKIPDNVCGQYIGVEAKVIG